MTDVHLPLNLNIEEFKGEQLRVTGDTDITVSTMLLKVSSIDGNTKLDATDIDSSQGIVNASGTAQLSDNWPVDITLNSTLNVEPLKGEKVKLKVGGALREQLEIGVNLSGPVDMDLRAQTRLAEAGLPLNVEVNSKQIYWPFTGEKQYQADDLKLKLTGKMTDYTLSMRTAVKGLRSCQPPLPLMPKVMNSRSISTNSPSRRWKGKLNSRRCSTGSRPLVGAVS